MSAGIWEAKYHSGCLACEGHISPGDPVKWADETVIHADCMVLDDSARPVPPVCPRCHMIPAVSGACECDS